MTIESVRPKGGVLDITPEDLATPYGRRSTVARLSALALFPDDAIRRMVWGLADEAMAEGEILSTSKAIVAGDVVGRIANGSFLAGEMLAEARKRFEECRQVGLTLGDKIISHRVGDCLTLSAALERHALRRRVNHRTGELRAEGADNLSKRWRRFRSVAHLAAAHWSLRSERRPGKARECALCSEFDITELLRRAETVRRMSIQYGLPKSEEIYRLPHDTVRSLCMPECPTFPWRRFRAAA